MKRLGGWLARETGLRFMARRKVACAMAVATMALAMGANTAVFSVLEAFLGSSFGLPEPDRVAILAPVRDLPGRADVVFQDAYPNYLFIRDTQRSFDAVACVAQSVSSWDDGSESQTVQAAKVTASFFSATGVRPQLGRAFEAAEEGPSPAPVVIVSYALWQGAMGGDPSALGGIMLLDGAPHTIVGVMPPGFAHPLPTDVWLPFDIPEVQRTTIAGGRNLTIYAHLRADVDGEQTESAMAELTRSVVETDAQNQDFRYKLVTIVEFVLPNADRTVVFVQIGALVLTLLAVVNLSSLLIAWGYDRRREMAVRVALGARGRSIVRMLVLQALVVVGAGALGGFALARLIVPAIRRMDVSPQFALFLDRLTLDGSVVAWSAVVAALAGVVAATLPAMLGRRDALGDALRSGRGSVQTPAALRWQKAMVLAQALLTVVILSTAALVGLSFRNLARVPDGFAAEGKPVARMSIVVRPRTSPEEALAALRRALRAADPVLAAGDVTDLPTLVSGANALPRLQAILLAAFALVATGIVVLGSYGLMSQLAASREREFALRVAVGAHTRHIGSQVLAQAARISGPGVLVGVGASWLLGGALRPFMFGVDSRSVVVTASVAAATLLLVGLATLPVAVRAMRVRVGAALTGG
jgi:putative ABC transport system permease protein